MSQVVVCTARLRARGVWQKFTLSLLLCLLLYKPVSAEGLSNPGTDTWYHRVVNIHSSSIPPDTNDRRPIVIAIVDDGVLMHHPSIAPYIWDNPREIPGNKLDDDANGFIDDVNGWDVADNDNDPNRVRNENNQHGTHLSGVLINALTAAYGSEASDRFRIMPVKVRSDHAQGHYLRSAFKGVEYAPAAGADVILSAWGVSMSSQAEKDIIENAYKRNIVIVASAGNLTNETDQFSASYPTVLAVAATNVDSKVLAESNFGQFVDISAPGGDILGYSTTEPGTQMRMSGTSQATALVAASAALVIDRHHELSAREVKACLVNHTNSFPGIPSEYIGKFGSGILDTGSSVHCQSLFDPDFQHRPDATRGFVAIQGRRNRWNLNFDFPDDHAGMRFDFHSTRELPLSGELIYKDDNSLDGIDNKVVVDTAESWPANGNSLRHRENVSASSSLSWIQSRERIPFNFSMGKKRMTR